MRFKSWLISLFIIFLFLSFYGVFAQSKTAKYIGANKCKMCHNSKKSGQQFKIWQSSAHAKAYRELTSEKANAVAQELGIDNPQTSEKCLKCHGTTGGKDLKLVKEGVGCENCHGPGSLYKSMKVMKDIATGKTKPEDFGMIKAGEEQCKECHNQNSPTYKEFDFKTFWAKIAHPRPTE